MRANEPEHDEKHQRMIRSLVEGSLAGEEKVQAEGNLLSCDECLEEYNWCSNIWESMTDRQAFHRWATGLSEKDPERYKLYSQIVEKLSKHEARREVPHPDIRSGYWFSVRIWRRLAFALSVILLIALSIGTYNVIRLQKAVKGQETYYQKLLAEKEEQRVREGPKVGALSKKVTELTTQAQQQAAKIDELSRTLAEYLKPKANAIVALTFSTARQPDQVHEIEVPKGTLFLNLYVSASEEKEYKTYTLIIKNGLGRALWQDERVAKDEAGNFNLLIPRDFLKRGEYVLEIHGLDRGRRDVISQTRFRIK